MSIVYHENTQTFHLFNGEISYLFRVMRSGHLGHLYFGAAIRDKADFGYLEEHVGRPMKPCIYEESKLYSLESVKQEYPSYGLSDLRDPAIEVLHPDGTRLTDLVYESHALSAGKPRLPGLPATYTEDDSEADTLTVTLRDRPSNLRVELLYTVYAQGSFIARSARIVNDSDKPVHLLRLMSLSLELPGDDYDMLQLSGAWSRERHLFTRHLVPGIQSIGSRRGHSSAEQNPFLVLKRPRADEFQGEAYGFSLVYSGNHRMQAEVDTHGVVRVTAGIHPDGFDWKLEPGECFQSPECVAAYSADGLNALSQTYHRLYRSRLIRGVWRDRVKPILINNWEATYFDFTEDRLVEIARGAQKCGVEMFVLDDGWFGKRCGERAGLGDWVANPDRLARGVKGVAERIRALGMSFGLWIEPEMVNMDSDLYRAHPDWMIAAPGRKPHHGRYQYVLDFSRPEVVDAIYAMLYEVLKDADVSYIKWDMNRSITDCYSAALPADRQGEVFHRYILGVYSLYERLIASFPNILFESCASGGGRFDAGMLYYAPQAWASDDSDAIERLKIQYGTSMCYPISSIGSHVSTIPNHQVSRMTPLHTRANVAYFGTFGYELDLNKLSEDELEMVRRQVAFMKEYRDVIQLGTFYRLRSPFEGNITAWMAVSPVKKRAVVGWYRTLNAVNDRFTRLQLKGLDSNLCYLEKRTGRAHYGDELMRVGLVTSDATAGEVSGDDHSMDFDSRLYVLESRD